MQPQRLIVPLFQRPYVWSREQQWEPLWEDVVRLAMRGLREPAHRQQPHFLGAVVLQQVQKSTGSLQERTVIDGQQRLTTLQILLDALHAEFLAVDARQQAKRLESLVTNDEAFCERAEDRFKVWPTNRDRPAFNDVMGAVPPVDYDALDGGARLVKAHRCFAELARAWLQEGGETEVLSRAAALEKVVREQLQVVVIDLTADENAQEIFETLNARGSQLTAADLIKNFVFQKVVEEGEDVERTYDAYWREFETGFWEVEISAGRARHPRASVFLNQWLIARTGEEVVAREVFSRFKKYAFDAAKPMKVLLQELKRSAGLYRTWIEASSQSSGPLPPLGPPGPSASSLNGTYVAPGEGRERLFRLSAGGRRDRGPRRMRPPGAVGVKGAARCLSFTLNDCGGRRLMEQGAHGASSYRMLCVRYTVWLLFFSALAASACKRTQCPPGTVLIPAGTFEMGTLKEVTGAPYQLKPRQVTLTQAYCMDRTEVTQRAFEQCQDAGGCYRRPDALPLPASLNNHPKDLLDWEHAVAFCKWRGGRLPTEAEWEFAARGTDGRLYPWGNEPPTKAHWRWPFEFGTAEVVDVGSYPKGRSFFGLDDMTGSVKEWVSDPCGEHDPKPDVDPQGPDHPFTRWGNCHIVRGAAWSAGWEDWAMATFRQYGVGGSAQIGFRCVYSPK